MDSNVSNSNQSVSRLIEHDDWAMKGIGYVAYQLCNVRDALTQQVLEKTGAGPEAVEVINQTLAVVGAVVEGCVENIRGHRRDGDTGAAVH